VEFLLHGNRIAGASVQALTEEAAVSKAKIAVAAKHRRLADDIKVTRMAED
jgi:hypothetical protein